MDQTPFALSGLSLATLEHLGPFAHNCLTEIVVGAHGDIQPSALLTPQTAGWLLGNALVPLIRADAERHPPINLSRLLIERPGNDPVVLDCERAIAEPPSPWYAPTWQQHVAQRLMQDAAEFPDELTEVTDSSGQIGVLVIIPFQDGQMTVAYGEPPTGDGLVCAERFSGSLLRLLGARARELLGPASGQTPIPEHLVIAEAEARLATNH